MKQSKTLDFIGIGLISMVLALTVIITQTASDILVFDAPWYTNRSNQVWNGYVGDGFVYKIGYPIFVGTLDLFINEVIISAMLFNWLMVLGTMIVTYLLARSYYNRPIALLAVLLFALNPSIYPGIRVLQPPSFFYFLVMLSLLLYRYLTLRPTLITSFGLGLVVTYAIYTRLEGVALAILLLMGAVQVFIKVKDTKRFAMLATAAAIPFVLGNLYYWGILLVGRGIGGDATAVFDILGYAPVRWDLLSRRITDSFWTVFGQWQSWLLILTTGMMVRFRDKFNDANLYFSGCTFYYVFVVFMLTIWPFELRAQYMNPIIAILVAWAIWRLYQLLPRYKWLAAALVIIAVVPGILQIGRYMQTPMFAYQQSEQTLLTHSMDDWIVEQGWGDQALYTFCQDILPFTQENFRLLYISDVVDRSVATHPNTILQLMEENGDLLVLCEDVQVFHQDWMPFFASPENYAYELVEAGTYDRYTFYQAVLRD